LTSWAPCGTSSTSLPTVGVTGTHRWATSSFPIPIA